MSRAENLRLLDILGRIATVREYLRSAREPLPGETRDAILDPLEVAVHRLLERS